MDHHKHLFSALVELPEDYDPFGKNERWADDDKAYPDCSGGCAYYYTLENRGKNHLSMDWGVCTNKASHRCGLLTFEHQGCQHFASSVTKKRKALKSQAEQ